MVLRPASAVRWYLPSRSMIFTCFCGTILIAFIRTISRNERDAEEHVRRHVGVTSSTMPSAPTTRMRVPAAIGVADARRPVLAADVHAAGADRRLDVVRDDAFAADERFGARRHAGRAELLHHARPQQQQRGGEHDDEDDELHGESPKPRKAASGRGEGASADEDDAEMRDRDLDDRADERDRDPGDRPRVDGEHGGIIRGRV